MLSGPVVEAVFVVMDIDNKMQFDDIKKGLDSRTKRQRAYAIKATLLHARDKGLDRGRGKGRGKGRGRGGGAIEPLPLAPSLAGPDPVDELALEVAPLATPPLLPDSVVEPATPLAAPAGGEPAAAVGANTFLGTDL